VKGTSGWLFQRVTGMVLIAGLVVHFLVMHFSGPSQITFDFVMRRLSNPFWKAFDICFLVTILYHGFNGLWGIALEYVGSMKLLRISQALITAMVLGLLVTGVYIITL
jgi:succinate dehydrogenase / fumarate reductase membrane anchor subunit